MNKPLDNNDGPLSTSAGDLPAQDTSQPSPRQAVRKPYTAPRIASSRIFHKVMLASPQPGFPGCSTY